MTNRKYYGAIVNFNQSKETNYLFSNLEWEDVCFKLMPVGFNDCNGSTYYVEPKTTVWVTQILDLDDVQRFLHGDFNLVDDWEVDSDFPEFLTEIDEGRNIRGL